MSVDQIPIGKFSFMTRLSQKALRLYDRKGLLVPEEELLKGCFLFLVWQVLLIYRLTLQQGNIKTKKMAKDIIENNFQECA
ncbi:hypothetical protein RG963_09985 [Methanosarcina sp. Z-7115]|uniref:HTH merR-type domain-containing protein n=1 Tax=Methanosarcina baikalica TaxID=3073890 RepID=A0ABU2D281_9EURY|nr:hypothetical protein [Methanosarcina sp. Z-7115]MDR7666095.1 hypothetical protein [Methanosarcina sp. Z-7115]